VSIIQLFPSDDYNGKPTARIYSYQPVDITIVQAGKGPTVTNEERARRIEAKITRYFTLPVSRQVNTPNGRLSYLGILRGLEVLRYAPWGECGFLVVTLGGTVVAVKPRGSEGFDTPWLDEQAELLGIFTKPPLRAFEVDVLLDAPDIGLPEKPGIYQAPANSTAAPLAKVDNPGEKFVLRGDLTEYIRKKGFPHVEVWQKPDGTFELHGGLTSEEHARAIYLTRWKAMRWELGLE
jgi:hypothetical protein